MTPPLFLLFLLFLFHPSSGFEWFGRKAEIGENSEGNEIRSPPLEPSESPPEHQEAHEDLVKDFKRRWSEQKKTGGGRQKSKGNRKSKSRPRQSGRTVEMQKSLEVVDASILEGGAAEAAKNGIAAISNKVSVHDLEPPLPPPPSPHTKPLPSSPPPTYSSKRG